MKSALILMLGAAAGLLGGLAAGFLQAEPAGKAVVAAIPPELTARMSDLERSVADLAFEVRRLDQAQPLANTPAATADELLSGADGSSAEPVASPLAESELTEKILDAVAEREKAERAEREERFAARAAERETAFLTRLEAELGLNAYQRDELGRILTKRREAMSGFREKMRSGEMDRSTLHDEVKKIRDEGDQQIKDLLTIDQYDAYRAQLESQRGGGFGGGPGGGRGGGFGR